MSVDASKNIVIYGGSFNPPHICHQLTVLFLLETRQVDEVWIMPCFEHAFSKSLAPFEMRMDWCRALGEAFGERCKVTGIEAELPAPSRTIDTMSELERRHPGYCFSLALGSDIRSEFERWKDYKAIDRRYPIIWIGRVGQGDLTGDGLVLPDVSSSAIREALHRGESIDDLVPSRVLRLVEKSGWQW